MNSKIVYIFVFVMFSIQITNSKKLKKRSRQLFALDEIENLTLDRSLRQKQPESLLYNDDIEPLSNKKLEQQIMAYRPKFKKTKKQKVQNNKGRILSVKINNLKKRRTERKLRKKKDEIIIEYQEIKPKKKVIEGNEFFKKGRKLYEVDGQYLNANEDLNYYNYI